MIEISLEDFLEINRQASVGRLVHGLVHNLNGPLQNFGMDMDMIRYSILKGEKSPDELMEDVKFRLERMEEEFEKINRLIQNTACRSSWDDEIAYLGLDDFVEQELDFLKANLYFKHHVQTEVSFDEALPRVGAFHPGAAPGISGLLQVVVEEMERRKLNLLSIRAAGNGSGAEVRLTMGSGPLSDNFLKAFEKAQCGSDGRRIRREEMEVTSAFLCLASAGVTAAIQASGDNTLLTLNL